MIVNCNDIFHSESKLKISNFINELHKNSLQSYLAFCYIHVNVQGSASKNIEIFRIQFLTKLLDQMNSLTLTP